MKKKKIKTRSIIYSVVAVALSTSFILSLLFQIPSLSNPRSQLKDFPGGVIMAEEGVEGEMEEEKVLEKDSYSGVPMGGYSLGDNSYHVSEKGMETFLKENRFRFNRWNPTLHRVGGVIEIPKDPTIVPAEDEATEQMDEVDESNNE